MKLNAFLLAGTCALALAACRSNTPTPAATDAAADAAMTSAAMNTPAPPAPALNAAAFVQAAAASDTFELQSSKLAGTKAKSAAVRNFAAMMIKAHTQSTVELKAAAAKATPPITVSPALTPEQSADLDALRTASAADFDPLYVQKQVAGHEKTLAAVQAYAANGDAAPLKEFATKLSPIVSEHLDRARKLPR